MKLPMGLSLLATLLVLGCAAKSTESGVTGTDPAAMRNAPAGVATLVFMDLQTVRPDALPTQVALPPNGEAMALVAAATAPSCATSTVAGNVTTYTFNCKAANTGSLTGTLAVTTTKSGTSTVYAEVFNLTSTIDASHKWQYTGNQTITVGNAIGTLTVTAQNPITAAYTDSAVPANSKSYAFTAALSGNWATSGRFALTGSYGFARTGETITVAISQADPLVWTTGCDYPSSGTLGLTLVDSFGTATTSAVFGPTCGQVTIGGGTLSLGGH